MNFVISTLMVTILLRRRREYGLQVANTVGPRNTYTEIGEEQLCNAVRDILGTIPDAGETYVIGALRSRGIHIQRWRVRNAIQAVDHISRALRRTFAVVRRVYNVRALITNLFAVLFALCVIRVPFQCLVAIIICL